MICACVKVCVSQPKLAPGLLVYIPQSSEEGADKEVLVPRTMTHREAHVHAHTHTSFYSRPNRHNFQLQSKPKLYKCLDNKLLWWHKRPSKMTLLGWYFRAGDSHRASVFLHPNSHMQTVWHTLVNLYYRCGFLIFFLSPQSPRHLAPSLFPPILFTHPHSFPTILWILVAGLQNSFREFKQKNKNICLVYLCFFLSRYCFYFSKHTYKN